MQEKPQKFKRGFRRDDGMVFWQKIYGRETWLTEEEFKVQKEIQKQKSREYYLKNQEALIEKTKKYTQENLESKRQYWKEYIQKNKKKKQQYRLKYKAENSHKISEDGKRYRKNNVEKMRSYFQQYREKNAKKIADRLKRYNEKYPEIGMEAKAKNRAKRRDAAKSLTDVQKKINRQFFLMSRRLKQCLNINWHVDHIIPISRGGLHVPSNLMVMPAKLNLRKSARTDLDFSQWRTREDAILIP
jgi:5-methylcytosine-specific restriction endonuclease McrA